MLPPLLVCVYYGENHEASGLFHAIWTGAIVGMAMFLLLRHIRKTSSVRDGYLLLAVLWLAASVFGAFPYYFSDVLTNPIDAFFESASGFSTTGATVFHDVESVPKGILLWRSMTSWMGGAGILIFAVSLMPSLGVNGTSVAEPDKPSVNFDRITPKIMRMFLGVMVSYSIITLVEIILLCCGGMGLYDSVIHSLGTVSTGGFSNYNDGLTHFDGIFIRVVIVIFMIVAGTNFTMFYSSSRRGLKAFTEDTEFIAYWIIMVVAFVLIFGGLFMWDTGWSHTGEAANAAFMAVSTLTTTGFVSDNYTMWPAFAQMIIVLLMIIGGCSSSTSSGNKVVRLVVLSKLVLHGLQTRLHPNVIKPVKLNRKDLPNDTVSAVSNHMFLFVVMVFVGVFVLAFENLDMTECFTAD
ncbi:MAG: TrkH family potassium uptake protein, partial [Bacillota bacterium]